MLRASDGASYLLNFRIIRHQPTTGVQTMLRDEYIGYPEIILPFNHYTDLLRPLVAKLVPNLDDDQQAIVRDAITSHDEFSEVLTEKFAPFCFYQIIEPKVRLVASKNNCEFELDNVNCVYQGMVADCNLDATHFNIFLQLAFESEFAPYQNPQNSFVGNLAEGLAGYLLDAYFDELRAMLEPLLDGSEAAELVKSASLCFIISLYSSRIGILHIFSS